MIKLDQIEEWMHEVEERPTSAPLIIRYISNRLRDLSNRNEELLAENIELRTGRKVEDYETRIANLEYQLDLLKRQLGGEMALNLPGPVIEVLYLVLFTTAGQVIRIDLPIQNMENGCLIAELPAVSGKQDLTPRLLVTNPNEELLFVFDSGRTLTLPANQLPVADAGNIAWKDAYLAEPRGSEELAALLPIGRMSLYDCCVQASRRGCVKKMMRAAFESHVAKGFVGTGVKQKPDRTASLTFCEKDEQFVLVSQEGYLVTLQVSELPYTTEESLRLSATDHIVSSFRVNQKPNVLFITQSGKAVVRESSWLEKASTAKSRGQAIFSASRREAGVRIAGAAAVSDSDWSAVLFSDGKIHLYSIANLLATGTIPNLLEDAILREFTVFSPPNSIVE